METFDYVNCVLVPEAVIHLVMDFFSIEYEEVSVNYNKVYY